jgi:hypothetical protein
VEVSAILVITIPARVSGEGPIQISASSAHRWTDPAF